VVRVPPQGFPSGGIDPIEARPAELIVRLIASARV
jgi:hypothetical protein